MKVALTPSVWLSSSGRCFVHKTLEGSEKILRIDRFLRLHEAAPLWHVLRKGLQHKSRAEQKGIHTLHRLHLLHLLLFNYATIGAFKKRRLSFIQPLRRIHLVQAIPEQVVRLRFRNVVMIFI